MDTLTHSVFGACLGELVAGRQLGKKAMLFGALASNVPDLDFTLNFVMSQADSMLAHRGFSHSILFTLLAGPLLAGLFHLFYRNKSPGLRLWMILWISGILFHILLDLLTVYGVGLLEPFSRIRIAFNVLFVADPVYTLPMLIAGIILVSISIKSNKRVRIAIAGLLISTLYVGYAVANKIDTDRVVRDNLSDIEIKVDSYLTTPTPFNCLLWYIVAKTDDGFLTGYYSVFDQNKNIQFREVMKNDSLLKDFAEDKDVDALRRFSQGYYQVQRSGDTTFICDLRFGEVGGWYRSDPDFVFRYALDENVDNMMVIQKGRLEASSRESLEALWNRIRGIKHEYQYQP